MEDETMLVHDPQNMVHENPSKDLISSKMETVENGLGSLKEDGEAFAREIDRQGSH